MIRIFIISAIRNLRKNCLYTAINVLGLALGVACCLVIFVIVKYETSFDDYHAKASRIYRVNLHQEITQARRFNGNNYSPLAETIRAEVSGLEAVTGVYCLEVYQFAKNEDLFEDRFAFFADESYADVFDVEWMAGNPQEALKKPNTVVVTDSFAEKFLGGISNALGSNFILENKLTLTVTGIVRSPPSNTDHPYSILISYSSLAHFIPETVDNWETIGSGATYVVFHENTSHDQIDKQFDNLIQKYLRKGLYGLVSFMAIQRTKEIGIRKVFGAAVSNIMMLFTKESAILIVGAFVFAAPLAHFTGIAILLEFPERVEPGIGIFVSTLLASLLIAVLTVAYRSFNAAVQSPVDSLRTE